ncbi:MAG: metallopeptidase family protein [Acidobacteria bacterium]|nr:metallopeptidase family protein [Acidobacteriota bacterium]
MIGMAEFEELVAQALEDIPEDFLAKLDNVEIVVEEAPSPELLKEMGLLGRGTLFGLYQGIPRTHKSSFHFAPLPDRIVIFRRPIVQACRTRERIIRQVKITVLHEVAHHFGFSEERLRELGYG